LVVWLSSIASFFFYLFLMPNLDQRRRATAFSVPVAVTPIPTAASAGHHLFASGFSASASSAINKRLDVKQAFLQ
jgi:hypothetical protein